MKRAAVSTENGAIPSVRWHPPHRSAISGAMSWYQVGAPVGVTVPGPVAVLGELGSEPGVWCEDE